MVGKVASVSCEPCVFYSAIPVLTVNSSYTLCPPPLLTLLPLLSLSEPDRHFNNSVVVFACVFFYTLLRWSSSGPSIASLYDPEN